MILIQSGSKTVLSCAKCAATRCTQEFNAMQCNVQAAQTISSLPIPTISYSPAPSRPLPLPLPLDWPTPSSSPGSASCAVPIVFPVLAPKLIGRSSRHWQAQVPMETIKVALQACNAHQNRFEGSACEYKEVTIRCMKCIVSAKSKTSFERAMSSSMKTALSER